MASNIDTTSIDATFPVAGQDNNSQGFRDNFNVSKNNFTAAKSEIETLQTNTAKLNAENNFSGNVITGATFKGNYTKHFDGGAVTSGQNVSLTNGNFQTFNIGADLTLTLADWATEANVLQSMVISLVSDGSSRELTLAASGGTIKKDDNFPAPFNVTSNNNSMIIELWTYDQGVTVFARYLGTYA
jgi:hypothetical protein